MSDPNTNCQHWTWSSVTLFGGQTQVHICGDCGERLTGEQFSAESITVDDMRINLGAEIAKALQIDTTRVTSLRLEMHPGGIPVLEISRAVFGDDHKALRSVLERYRVTPIASAPQVDSQASTGLD